MYIWLVIRIYLFLGSISYVSLNDDYSKAISSFSINFYQQLRQSVQGNIVFSPYSISTAFAMVATGAKGQTKSQMNTGFNWGNIDLLYKNIQLMSKEVAKDDNNTFLSVANKVWVENSMTILETYQTVLQETFAVKVEREDFLRNPENARGIINAWVEKQTDDKIKNLFPTGSINSASKLVLANAIYFKGKWENPFLKESTRKGPFYLKDGNTVQVDFMTNTNNYAMFQDNSVEVLEMPYSGQKFSMIFVKPINDNLEAMERQLNYNKLNSWFTNVRTQRPSKTVVQIPKFEFGQSIEGLNDIMKKFGVTDVYDPERADLSGMNGKRNLFVSAAIHKAFIKLDEEGTVAAAATGIVVGITSVVVEQERRFTLDRPFLFYIIDKNTKMVLFHGRMMNPGTKDSKVSSSDVKNNRFVEDPSCCSSRGYGLSYLLSLLAASTLYIFN